MKDDKTKQQCPTKNKEDNRLPYKMLFPQLNRKLNTWLLACGVTLISGVAGAQDYKWANGMGSTGIDEGHSIAVDASGNVYSTGYFNGTVDFDPGPGTANLTSTGS
ncbi:MAG: hypothetical protein COA57_14230, partial [Flavobacteriales bacterium]